MANLAREPKDRRAACRWVIVSSSGSRSGRTAARAAAVPLVAFVLLAAAFAAGRWSAPSGSAADAASPGTETTPGAKSAAAAAEKTSLMWTLHGDAVWVERNGAARILVVEGPDRDVVWFTDRPVRKSGRMTIDAFLGSWDDPQFREDPPNAAITAVDGGDARPGGRRDAVVELTGASYDREHDTLRFSCRCQVGDVDSSWLLATGPDRPFAGAVSLMVDPYETPVPDLTDRVGGPATAGFFDDVAQHAYCRLYWAPRSLGGQRGYRGATSPVLSSSKWDTDEWTTEPSYAGDNPRGVGWGTWGVSETRSGGFRGCSHTVRIGMPKGYSYELTVSADYRLPLTPQKGSSTCTLIDPNGRRRDGQRDGRCQVVDVHDMNGTGQSYVWELDTWFY